MKNKIFIFFLLILSAVLNLGCSKKQVTKKEIAYPVQIATSQKKDSPIFSDNIGHVESITSVDIRSRIEGQLMDVHFSEGDYVKKGDLLFTIDPRPYKANLDKAIGLLDESVANLYIAKDRFIRNKDLIKDEYISQLDFETLTADVAKNEALVKQNQANVDNAELNLEYCYIYSPFKGKTGILQIDKGNMIYPNSNKQIITLNQIAPIYVTFYLPEKELPRIQKYNKICPLKLKVAFEDLDLDSIDGTLHMIDNEVDAETGMIKLRGIFNNLDKDLWPGKFVKTRLIITTEKDAIVIPFKAVVLTSKGPTVFVIKEDNKAELRNVKLGQREQNNIIILSGIKDNEKVVVDGQLNLKAGSKVNIKTKDKK